MIRKTVSLAVLAAALGVPALANEVNPGLTTQARIVGVQPGSYSASELGRLDAALTEGQVQTAEAILSRATGSSSGVGVVTPGKAALASGLGVNAADYSLADLIRADEAKSKGQTIALHAILGNETNAGSAAGQVTPGKATLAATLGVNPADYSLADLVALEARLSGTED